MCKLVSYCNYVSILYRFSDYQRRLMACPESGLKSFKIIGNSAIR